MFHDDMIMYANIYVLLTIDQKDDETWHEQQENKGKDKLNENQRNASQGNFPKMYNFALGLG